MQIIPYTYNGHGLNDGTVSAWIPKDAQHGVTAKATYLERSGTYPQYAGKTLAEKVLPLRLEMRGESIAQQFGTVSGWFDVTDQNTHKLVVQDAANSNKQWQVDATPISIPAWETKMVTVSLGIADPIWESVSSYAGTILVTASGQKGTVTAGGNHATAPVITVKPTSSGGTGYAYRRGLLMLNNTDKALMDYPLNVTGGTIDTATAIGASKMQADCDDLRIYVDKADTDRWLNGANSGTTSAWINANLSPKITMTLSGSVVAAGTVTSLTFVANVANANNLKKIAELAPSGGVLVCGTEAFTYTGYDLTTNKVTGVTQGARGTTKADHAANSVFYWIEHEAYVYYGNTTIGAPETDDAYKPIINLVTSTNNSWVYTEFADGAGYRTASWKPALLSSVNTQDMDNKSGNYGGTATTYADPVTDAGMVIRSFRSGAAWKSEQAQAVWTLYDPVGGTAVTVTGQKYRSTTTWPSAQFYKSQNGSTYNSVWVEATPGTVSTWTPLATHSAVSLAGTYQYLKASLSGTQPASASAYAAWEMSALTWAKDTAKVPTVIMTPEEGCYNLQVTLTNETTGKAITLTLGMLLDQTLTIDCANKTITLSDGSNAMAALSMPTRLDWFDLLPGANVIRYDDPGTNGATVTLTWHDKEVG